MKIKKSVLIIFLCFLLAVLPACNKSGSNSSELKIGVEGLSGNYNPFYAENEADIEVISQMFRPIQIRGTDNALINHSGSISYEFVGDDQVKYTVSIDDGMRYSDGTHITIDDVIYYYHFISDASYDGTYKDWYLNDIEGLKEYYYDDKNYADSVAEIENTVESKYTLSSISVDDYTDYLVKTKLEGKFESADQKLSTGQTWKDYLSTLGYDRQIIALGEKPTDEAWLRLVATAEAEKNPLAYNPEEWYRENLYNIYLENNYLDGADVSQISGIKKINDYSCSILFNSRNINAISEINALIIPKSCYATEYVKGSAETVKEMTWFAVGSGPYIIAENSDEEVKMSYNEFYSDEESDFRNLKFIDLGKKDHDPIDSVKSGRVDVVKTIADQKSVASLKDSSVQYFINNCDHYVSAFFNPRIDIEARKALIGICNPIEAVENAIGSYYTRVLYPLSVRYPEYPSEITESLYSDQTFLLYYELTQNPVRELTAYYCGDESDLEYAFLTSFKEKLSENKITLDIVIAEETEYKNAITSGKADMWIDKIYDGPTVDKYDYFNVEGENNKVGLDIPEINALTVAIRSGVGFTDKEELTSKLLNAVMQQAVECPLYQLQEITVYNTEKINPESFAEINESDGFTCFIYKLKSNK